METGTDRRLRLTALLLAAAAIGGCASSATVPEDRYYRLPPVQPGETLRQPLIRGTLAVAAYDSAAVFRDRAFAYVKAPRPHELRHYHFDHWADDPPTLLQHHLVDYLRAANLARQVVTDGASLDWNYLLKGHLKRFERAEKGGGAEAMVEITFALERFESRTPVLVKTYRAAEPIRGDDIYTSVDAFAAALDDIYARLLADIRAGL
ncbi:MAG: ABC-type transport auxiliary lipoprotein family protein [Pseudomonadota bacterium]